MEQKRTRLDEKNEFLGSSNNLAAEVTRLISEISVMTDREVNLPNIGKIYQNKILELEGQFQERNLDYFSKEQYEVRTMIVWDILTKASKAVEILEQKEKWLHGFLLLNQIRCFKAFSNRVIEWLLKDYIKIANEMNAYSMEKDFVRSIIERLYSNNYDAMSPGSYKLVWKQGKHILTVFGLEDQISRVEPEILPLIEAQEKASIEYLKSWNHHV